MIYYDASFVVGFGSSDGVTMGKRIYINKADSSANVGDPGFTDTTKLLLHEFTHSKQYQALGYNTVAFGTKYLFNWCKVRFHHCECLEANPTNIITGRRIPWKPDGKHRF